MDLQEFKKQYIRNELGITEDFGRTYSFVDFGNVNHWFEEDRQDSDNKLLKQDEKLVIDIESLRDFANLFSEEVRFYYGHDRQNIKSFDFIRVARSIYGRHKVFTKQIQKVRHHLSESELVFNTRDTQEDHNGTYVYIPKCNFDVEITVDAVKLIDKYKTFCLFSSDADFVHLARFLKGKGKKIILIKGGNIIYQWRVIADVIVNAQKIKRHISRIKQKPGDEPGLANRKPVSTGR